ncbi:serine/threonine-protein kinase [Crocosphaera chwakensis]|uniref:non-specific serine/threonine protein kinase n=1 Tax=Crocosphaera chwakensis CCY0110 TaxID=391612 RepID=A3IST9_9CHRO|nr:serine/threonine-protein kinase [Crocosphaera chwakensis]EAZ90509.1 protein kinase; PknA [Crocosphaera chwakensis CCY0110]
MEILCTRPGCSHPQNNFSDLDDPSKLKTVQQKYCTSCGMPLILTGRYLPSKLLGKGGFGAAFLAQDRFTPTMRLCVVKQFQPEGNLNAQSLAIAQDLFEREAVILEDLGSKHPQIPQLYAFFPLVISNPITQEEEQFFYLVQELIDGEDLETELKRKGIFLENEVIEVLHEILLVLQFIHDNNCIHRDIKPSNIMRDKQGRLYLLDFGAVKQVTATAGNPQKRSTGIYSMGFAPPEQMQGSAVYPATDLYALATTCLNLLTGKSPEELYDSYNNRWNWQAHVTQVSEGLANILDRLLLPSPSERYQSASEVLQALHSSQTQGSSSSTKTSIQASANPPIPSPAPISPTPKKGFSSVDLLIYSGFTGFEGAILILGLKSFLAAPGIIIGCIIITGLIYLQSRRILDKKDLFIVGIITALLLIFCLIFGALGFESVSFLLISGLVAAAGLIAITSLFKLIYQLLSSVL